MRFNKKNSLLGFTTIFLIFLFLRLINLDILPIFADEAIYIRWAQRAWHNAGERFIALTDGKPPLHTWLMIPFLKVLADPLLAGRLLSVLGGLTSLLGVFLITRFFSKNKATPFLISFLLVLSPFMLFYDRLAVADSLLTAAGVWSLYLSFRLRDDSSWTDTILLGVVLGAARLIKPSALFFTILAIFSFLALFLKKPKKLKKIYFAKLLVALILSFLVYSIIKLSPYPHLITARTYDYILGKREFLSDPFRLFWGNLKAIMAWIYSYQGLLPSIFILISLSYGLKKNQKTTLIFLSWVLFPILSSAFIGRIIFPRYFVIVMPFLLLLLIPFIDYALNKWGRLFYPILLLVFSYWFYFDFMLLTNPVKAPLHIREQSQYLASWSAGFGIKESADYLRKLKDEKIYVATEGYFGTLPDGLQVYLDDKKNIEVYGIGQPIYNLPDELKERAKTYPTFLIVNDSRLKMDKNNLKVIRKFDKPEYFFQEKESLLLIKL